MGSSGHRWFAAAWQRMSNHESPELRELRREVAGGATGRVLELGYGVGTNWPFYPLRTEYVGIEPDPYMRRRAPQPPKERAMHLVAGDAERLPFADGSFETVVATLVLCTIPDAGAALQEVRRVLKPGGELRFAEHVRARGRAGAALQTALTPLWKQVGGGCHLNRRTLEAIASAGFTIQDHRRQTLNTLPVVVGRAVAAEEGRSA